VVGWSTSSPGRFNPGKDPVPIVYEAGWAPGPVWTGVENLVPTGIRFREISLPLVKSKVKQSLYWPGQELRVPGGYDCQTIGT